MRRVSLRRDPAPARGTGRGKAAARPAAMAADPETEALFQRLRRWRLETARAQGIPPYVIFQDPSLEEMTVRYPITIEELTQVSGVGPGKAQKYGKLFVDADDHARLATEAALAP